MEHSVSSPFPCKNRKGEIIIDEMCDCGLKRSDHADTVAFGHGASARCSKFTWAAMVFAPQASTAKD